MVRTRLSASNNLTPAKDPKASFFSFAPHLSGNDNSPHLSHNHWLHSSSSHHHHHHFQDVHEHRHENNFTFGINHQHDSLHHHHHKHGQHHQSRRELFLKAKEAASANNLVAGSLSGTHYCSSGQKDMAKNSSSKSENSTTGLFSSTNKKEG